MTGARGLENKSKLHGIVQISVIRLEFVSEMNLRQVKFYNNKPTFFIMSISSPPKFDRINTTTIYSEKLINQGKEETKEGRTFILVYERP